VRSLNIFFFSFFLVGVSILEKKAISVIMSICGSAPFNGAADQSLSVAYISVFNLVLMVRFHRF
jgi:hypothetical protein